MDDKLRRIFKKAYKLLENVTPLPVDCGQLCNGVCCEGDENTGMLLFPGEEELYENEKNFLIKETEFELRDGFVVKLLICKENCDRKKRPLACRIFPLFVDFRNGGAEPYIDPRANDCCPLALAGINEGVSTRFITRTIKAFEILIKDDRIKEFIDMMNEELRFDLEGY